LSDSIAYTQVSSWIHDFKELTKVRLALSVVFSSIAGYLLGVDTFNIGQLVLLALGGYAMVGASNAFNQIIEKNLDAKMKRTKNRPLPSGSMSTNTAFSIATLLTVIGLSFLFIISPITAMFGAISIFLYVSVYTPLKTITPLSVFVGAFPGAIPFMLGWVAATGSFGIEAGALFMIQFFWQFPHFWALGWWLYDDYKEGGFFMLPTGKRDKGTAIQIILYTIWTLIVSIIPALGVTGDLKLSIVSAVLVFILGLIMLFYAIKLFQKREIKYARQLMLASVFYITLIQIIYVSDKYIRIWFLDEKHKRARMMMMWFGIISMAMMFAGLTSAYVVSKSRPDWLTDYQLPDVFIWSTLVIFISSITFHLSKKFTSEGDLGKANAMIISTFILGVLFVVMQFVGFNDIVEAGYYFTGSASSVTMSFIYLLVLAHLVHVLAGLIVLLVVIYNHFKKKYSKGNMLGLRLGVTFWHFVDGLWLYLFLFLYFFR